MIKRLILRKIISLSIFWKIRHLIQPDFLKSYKNKPYNKHVIDFIEKLIEKKTSNIFFDYGCSCASTLLQLGKRYPQSICVGVDINKESLKIAKSTFLKNNPTNEFLFVKNLEEIKIKDLLKRDKNILLSIFDRVLYCINDKNFEELKFIIINSKYVFIDDFFFIKDKNFSYRHRDYLNIMNSLNFSFVKSFEIKDVDGANPIAAIFQNNRLI